MTHRKVSQFWVSENGARVTGRKEHGYFAVCSCGAEVPAGPSTPYDATKPSRLLELEHKERTEAEESEYDKLWDKWDREWRSKLEKSMEQDRLNMLRAIEEHAKAKEGAAACISKAKS